MRLWEAIKEIDLQKIIDEIEFLVQGDASNITIEDLLWNGLLQENKFEMNEL